MARRVLQPDTDADIQLREIITASTRSSFVVVAGAGSGKTTSLVKALDSTIRAHGAAFRRNRQRVACITYTEVAAKEIWNDVGNNPLAHVSTIHSFLWSIVHGFQRDIRAWVLQKIESKLDSLRTEAAAFTERTRASTRQKNQDSLQRYESHKVRAAALHSFRYGTGSDYANGILGHDDILKLATSFLSERHLLRLLVGQQFPFIFVDESQDTMPSVVDALRRVEAQLQLKFCLGFFGDPMQQIYATGIGRINAEPDWHQITKPQNFRCSARVLAVANAIRHPADGLVQVSGQKQPLVGSARAFVLPADARRDERIQQVRARIAEWNNDEHWRPDSPGGVKTLVIVHRMAAQRLGFATLYSAFNDEAPEALKAAFLEATAWPLRPFMQAIVPLARAVRAGKEFDAMAILRAHSPRLAKQSIRNDRLATVLRELRAASERLAELMSGEAQASCAAVLRFVRDAGIVALDPRLNLLLDQPPLPQEAEQPDTEESADVTALRAFFSCPAVELWGYEEYMDEQSPFSTQQGIKGTEFPRVLVILDDEEGNHPQFSYEKYLGMAPLSARDQQNLAEGRDTVVDRTRRLFYVCCTRALVDLAVVVFAQNTAQAEQHLRAAGLFAPEDVHRID